ncbi:hypothetical protein [Viscerimonas tarda]
MDLFKTRLLIFLIAFGLIAGAGVGLLLYYVFPQFYPGLGVVNTAVFFLVIEICLFGFVASKSEKVSSKKMVNIYMLAKVVKMLLSLIFVAVYVFAVKENVRNFILVFVIFYAQYLFIETLLFSKLERHLKEKNEN